MLSKKTQYALQALSYMAGEKSDDPILIAKIAQEKNIPLKFLESIDNNVITMHIDSPGGSVKSGLSMVNVMKVVKPKIKTVNTGMAASMGQFILTAGAPGKRFATPHARILMHQPLGGIGGTATDIRIQAEQMAATKKIMAEIIAKHTGQSVEQITIDSDRDNWFTADEAKEYGFVDQVVRSAGQVSGSGGTA